MSKHFLERYRQEGDSFLRSIMTGDETWVFHYDPETKRQSMEWRHSTSPRVRKFKTAKSAGKIMLTIFWDSRGVIHKEYMVRSTTINSASYCVTLQKLKTRIRRIRPTFTRFLLHHDNARPHCSAQTNAKIKRLGFEVIPHPPYSPDLAPSDFHLFPQMKEGLKGNHFTSDDEVQNFVDRWLRDLGEEFFFNGFQKWISRLQKCIDVNGDYVEK